jgi:magnesium chelatase family protein
MAVAHTWAIALRGVTGHMIEVQVDMSSGIPGLFFTGLADVAVVEARDRIRSAMQNSGVPWPNRRITVALLPADVRKVGSRFDLAMALAMLAASETITGASIAGAAWIAELGLDGRLRPVRGVLPSVVAARAAGITRVLVAPENAAEAALVEGVQARSAYDLSEVIQWLRGDGGPPPMAVVEPDSGVVPAYPDLADVAGQAAAKRGLEIAAAGGHHLYLVGSPGAGKTMLAERLPGLLPELGDDQALDVTAVHSVAGALSVRAQLVRRAPFQSPHHTASVAALVGGGSGLAGPGAISLAHNGVLFLDEAPEFNPRALEALRQPLESGEVVLHRSGGVVRFPARFLLVLAANPCQCGNRDRDCVCAPFARRRYQQRISGPLLDRIDVRVQVDPVPHAELLAEAVERETSTEVAARVQAARAAARARWQPLGYRTNAEVPGSVLRRPPWRPAPQALDMAQTYFDRGQLSARGFDRVLRMGWTIADLNGREVPDAGDLAEAVYFRSGRADSGGAR